MNELAQHLKSTTCAQARAFEASRFRSQWLPLVPGWPRSVNGTGTSDYHYAFNNLFVSHALKAVYVANQKAGSRTIINLLEQYGTVHVYSIPYSETWQSRAWTWPAQLRSYLLFTFVRDPLQTFLSGVSEIAGRHFRQFPTACPTAGSRSPTFMSVKCGGNVLSPFFEDVRARRCIGTQAYHVWPQVAKLDVRVPWPLDFVGRVEWLEDDMARLLSLLQVAHADLSARLKRLNDNTTNLNRCGEVIHLETALVGRGTPMRAALCELLKADYACGFAPPGDGGLCAL